MQIGIGLFPDGATVANGFSLSMTDNGLWFEDLFDRVDNPTLDNNWSETPAAAVDLHTDRARFPQAGTRGFAWQTPAPSGTLDGEFMIDSHWHLDNTLGIWLQFGTPSASTNTSAFAAGIDRGNSFYKLQRYMNSGAENDTNDGAFTFNATDWYKLRLVVEKSGSVYTCRCIGMAAGRTLPSEEAEDTQNYVEHPAALTTSFPSDISGWFIKIQGRNHLCSLVRGMGQDIVVSNVPTGYKCRVGSQTAVVESGGVVTIDPKLYPLPASSLTLMNSLDEDIVTYDATVFYGGATFDVNGS